MERVLRLLIFRGVLGILTCWLLARQLNWPVALFIIISILVHELGHLWQARRLGVITDGIVLIPFLGGATLIDSNWSRLEEGKIALMGPVFSLVEVMLIIILGFWSGLREAGLVLASLIAGLIVMNMLPLLPFDGGRIWWAIWSAPSYATLINRPHGRAALASLGLLTLISPLMAFVCFLLHLTDRSVRTSEPRCQLTLTDGDAHLLRRQFWIVCSGLSIVLVLSLPTWTRSITGQEPSDQSRLSGAQISLNVYSAAWQNVSHTYTKRQFPRQPNQVMTLLTELCLLLVVAVLLRLLAWPMPTSHPCPIKLRFHRSRARAPPPSLRGSIVYFGLRLIA